MNKNKIKSTFINILIFVFISIVLVNFFHNSHNNFIKSEKLSGENNSQIYLLDTKNLKERISETLISEKNYKFYLDRECQISGNMHDRHKVRWVKQLFLKKIFQNSANISSNSPYYLNIFIHSLLIFLSIFFIGKTFTYDKKYDFFFLLYITFIFQQYLGEYSFSIFEMFFISLALYASKYKKIFLFFFICLLASLNRESGFIVLLNWLVFNNDFKKFFITAIIVFVCFVIINFQLVGCLFIPKFYIPLENQTGQINFTDLQNANLFSILKLLTVNFLLPFGIFFYFYLRNFLNNKTLLTIVLIYLVIFIIATPAHHAAVRLLIVPFVFAAISLKNTSIKS